MKGFHRQAVSSFYLEFYFLIAGFQDGRKFLRALAVSPFMVSLGFYGGSFFMEFSVNGKSIIKLLATKFSPLFFFCIATV